MVSRQNIRIRFFIVWRQFFFVCFVFARQIPGPDRVMEIILAYITDQM